MRLLLLLLGFFALGNPAVGQVVVGSKAFTEGYVMGEIVRRQIEAAGLPVELKAGLGNTGVVWAALRSGQIGVYPEYTGTIAEEILKRPGIGAAEMRQALAGFGVEMSGPLGFKDNYGIAVRRDLAERLKLRSISDLARYPDLRWALTPELYRRADGWRGLAQRYGLRPTSLRTIEHALGYRALASGAADVKDCYTTDAAIARLDLVVLRDDRAYFPLYEGIILFRKELDPRAKKAIQGLEGTFTDRLVIQMNARAEADKEYAAAANLYFSARGRSALAKGREEGLAPVIVRLLGQHLVLVGIALGFAIGLGVPLGIVAARGGPLGGLILGFVGVAQTIPSLALLAFLVPLPFLGLSPRTAIVALTLYSLLPIVRNVATGLISIPPALSEAAVALGLSGRERLRIVELPMALPGILAGIETSAVIAVGTATLAALIGGGGLGTLIVSGLAVNDDRTILAGALPAAALALAAQLLFKGLERLLVPRGMRGGRS